METDLPRSLRMQIQFASLRLQLDRITSKLLVRLAWCLQLHLLNFTTLTLMADKPKYFVPIIAYQLFRIWRTGLISAAKDQKSKKLPQSSPWTKDGMKTFWLWMVLTLVFHRHSSPLAMVWLNRIIWKTHENGIIFWSHMFICKVLLTTDAGATTSLRIFFSVLRYFNLVSRAVVPLSRVWFF